MLTLNGLRAIAASGDYDLIPISIEIYSDMTTPIRVIQILKAHSHHCFLLESVDDSHQWGRFSFLGFDPCLEVTCLDGEIRVREGGDAAGASRVMEGHDPRPVIKDILSRNKSATVDDMPPFTGGLVGYFAYDYLKYSEPTLDLDAANDEGFNDVDLMMFDKVIAFDNARQKIVIIGNVRVGDPARIEQEYSKVANEIKDIANMIIYGTPEAPKPGRLTSDLVPLFEKGSYCKMVERAKEYIREGDIFQVVLSNRLSAPYDGSLLNAYRTLRTLNPSPYMFYFVSDKVELAGASPETLVQLKDNVLKTFPIAGSRPRGASPEDDMALEQELLQDEKELAEHNMLVDLGRNDIGKISEFGSVEVTRYQDVLRFSHIMHICSEVCGTMRADCSPLDAIDAVLPAGTLSGAPKIRAAQIINELEGCKRGIYGGAVGYISFTGNLDVCIAIRLAYLKDDRVYIRSGGGIVADSDPATEYQESINKAAAMRQALEVSSKGAIDSVECADQAGSNAYSDAEENANGNAGSNAASNLDSNAEGDAGDCGKGNAGKRHGGDE